LRKFFIVTLSLVLVLALAATATAGVRNTIHDFQSAVTYEDPDVPGNFLSTPRPGFADTAQRGMCSYCHIPHSSKGDRLWPTAGEDSAAKVGIIGVLCASCHGNALNCDNAVAPGGAGGVDRKTDIYNEDMLNHVLIDDGVYANNTNQNFIAGATQFGQVNTWPYCKSQGVGTTDAPTDKQRIECSSCHNPHSEEPGQSQATQVGETDTEANCYYGYGNDFLRASFYNRTDGIAFCEYCHEEKTRGGAALNVAGTGTHPVGESANAGDTAQQDIHIESGERATLAGSYIVSAVQYDMGIGTGDNNNVDPLADGGIGTHLTGYDTGGVTCQSCHKVHGAPAAAVTAGISGNNSWQRNAGVVGKTQGSYDDASKVYLGASDDGDCNILAVENDANGGTAGYTYWTEGRTASDYNDLCIDCHETTPSVGKNWADYDGDPVRTTADGAGVVNLDSHPVNIAPNGLSESGFALTVQDPSWTNKARWAGGNGVKMKVPTGGTASTNGDFFAANGRYDGDGSAPSNTRNEIVCLTCHSLHDGEDGSPILRSANTTFCSDCHTFSIGAVSHPVNYGAAMRDNPDDAVWPNGDNLPLEDYYQGSGASFKQPAGDTTTPMACFTCHAAHDGTDFFMLRVKDDNSRICTGCHTDIVALGEGANGNENPVNYIAEYADAPEDRLGSHYTGTISNSTDTIGEQRWAFSGAWTDTGYDGATAQTSHWNGNADWSRMQCQSCHTPHNAASGLVEANAYEANVANMAGNGGTSTTEVPDDDNPNAYNAGVYRDAIFDGDNDGGTPMCNTPTTALLLGNNVDSKMCATCHWPEGTHVTTIFSVPAKTDPERVAGGDLRKYRDYCTRIERTIIVNLRGANEQPYNVYDLIANDTAQDSLATPESPCNFPPLRPGREPNTTAGDGQGKMLCDSCHTPHAAGTAAGAFILDDASVGGDADPLAGPADYTLANQRVEERNYQELCWNCHDK